MRSLIAVACTLAVVGCGDRDDWAHRREEMVQTLLVERGITDPDVLAAMREVPRHEFVPEELRDEAYSDAAPSIGEGQAISPPYIVGLMTELLEVEPGDRVLEIGTGSGYQAAVLAELGAEVYTIEIRPRLCKKAEENLARLGYESVHVRCGDGYQGWPEAAPFERVIVTAAPERVPEPLLEQLAAGGKMVIPVGPFYQNLNVITRSEEGFTETSVIPVRFPRMTGEAESSE